MKFIAAIVVFFLNNLNNTKLCEHFLQSTLLIGANSATRSPSFVFFKLNCRSVFPVHYPKCENNVSACHKSLMRQAGMEQE